MLKTIPPYSSLILLDLGSSIYSSYQSVMCIINFSSLFIVDLVLSIQKRNDRPFIVETLAYSVLGQVF